MDYEDTFPGGPFRRGQRQPKGYDTALICTAGHVVNRNVETQPQHNTPHCSTCGRPTISACPSCKEAIRGEYHVPGVVDLTRGPSRGPAHCHACGDPYPWTAEAVRAARDLMDEFPKLSDEDRKRFAEALPDLLADTPSTPVAAVRLKKIATKAGKAALPALRRILEGVITGGASKMIWG